MITEASPNVDAVACESFLYNLAFHRPWYEVQFGGVLGIENQIPDAYTRVVEGFRAHYTDVLTPDDYAFHTIHIYGRRGARLGRRRLRGAVPGHRGEASLGPLRLPDGRRADAALLGRARRRQLVGGALTATAGASPSSAAAAR